LHNEELERVIRGEINTDEGAMAVAPDGRRIIYTASLEDYDLVEAPLDGGPVRELLATRRFEGMPAWSPVNQQFVFTTMRRGPQEIWLKSRSEGWERPLVTNEQFPQDLTAHFMAPVFSPDGQRIAYTRISAAGQRIWISALAGGAPIRLTNDEINEHPPSWSPDGAWLVFIRPEVGKQRLVKVRFGSADRPVILTETPSTYVPQWSPTGEWITCPIADGIGVISPDGKKSRALFKGRNPMTFWSKDGRTLYGVNRNANRAILLAIDMASGAERIAADLGQDFPASWVNPSRLSLAPDGKTFAYAVSRPRSDLWLLEGFELPTGPVGRLLRKLHLRNWHPLGQTLIVTSGTGWVQQQGGPVDEFREGDVVRIPPGVKHWHGATRTTRMTHIALQEQLDGKVVEWMEHVSDEQYRRPRETKAKKEVRKNYARNSSLRTA
jgi:mannose-6-phosphate isomerase-like protein (cupin superfamily)